MLHETSTNNNRRERLIRISRLCVWLLALLFLVIIAADNVALNGTLKRTYVIQQSQPPTWIQDFASNEEGRVIGQNQNGPNKEYFQLITKKTIPFSIPTLRNWKKATVTMVFDNPNQQPVIRLGVNQKKAPARTVDFAMYSKQLESMPSYWSSVRNGNTVLWQKNKAAYAVFRAAQDYLQSLGENDTVDPAKLPNQKFYTALAQPATYASVQAFAADPPATESITQFQHPLPNLDRLRNYKPATSRTVITTHLQGPHTLEMYIGNKEDIDVYLTFQHGSTKTIPVRVYRGDEKVFDQSVAKNVDTLWVHLSQPGEGVYEFRIQAGDDDQIQSIDSQNGTLYFRDHLRLADDDFGKAGLNIFADSSELFAQPTQATGKQKVVIDDASLRIEKMKSATALPIRKTPTHITLQKGNIDIHAAAIAFTKQQLFSSKLSFVRPLTDDTIVDDFDYILAAYPVVTQEFGHTIATAQFSARDLVKLDKSYQFVFSMVGFEEKKRSFRIYSVSVTLEADPYTLTNIVPRLWKHIFR